MENTSSCCISSSPRVCRNAHSYMESYCPEPELSHEDAGCNLQHISDQEKIGSTGMGSSLQPGQLGQSPLPQPMGQPLGKYNLRKLAESQGVQNSLLSCSRGETWKPPTLPTHIPWKLLSPFPASQCSNTSLPQV
uniref:Uncharacterized protein n=1 Tax=Gopherus evgoodei TaxID=1825980 RepID=A0A8C4W1L2_9SAUR